MRIGTVKMSKDIDMACVNEIGIPLILLMENAALKVVKHLETDKYTNYTILCGPGNNGGDGLAIARHLCVLGKKVDVFVVFNELRNGSECFNINYDILRNMGVPINELKSENDLEKFKTSVVTAEVIVDALLGTGLNKEVEGIFKEVISIVNELSSYTVSVDIPSGMNGDTGKILGGCIKADKTVSFELYKRGFLRYGSEEYAGKIVVESIGIPDKIIEKYHNDEFILKKSDVLKYLKPRNKYSHKGNYGRTLIIAGTKGYSGAAYLATQAAVRTGSGLVTLCCSKEIQDTLSNKLAEGMTCNFEEKERLFQLLNISNSIAIGPGLGNNEKTLELLELVLENGKGAIVIDADGLNVLSQNPDILKKARVPVIITPHPGEMSRLTNIPIEEINLSRLDISKDFALKHNVIVLLKGYKSVISNGRKTYVNPTGNSAMASGGMGDCLTGIIASLVSQGIPAFEAAAIGAYIHGYIGDKLVETMYSVNAGHVIEELPYAMKELISDI